MPRPVYLRVTIESKFAKCDCKSAIMIFQTKKNEIFGRDCVNFDAAHL